MQFKLNTYYNTSKLNYFSTIKIFLKNVDITKFYYNEHFE